MQTIYVYIPWATSHGGKGLPLLHSFLNRLVEEQKAQLKLKKFTKQDLMVKFHQDEAYVNLVIANAIRLKQFESDVLCPNDQSKIKYWGIDEESIAASSSYQIETALTDTKELDGADAAALGTGAGVFNANRSITFDGMSSGGLMQSITMSQSVQCGSGGGRGGRGGRGGGGRGRGTTAPGRGITPALGITDAPGITPAKDITPGSAEGAPAPGQPLKDPNLVHLGTALLKDISKAKGAAETYHMEMEGLNASATLVKKMRVAAAGLSAMYKKVVGIIKDKEKVPQTVDKAAFEQAREQATRLLDQYEKAAAFAKAFLNVQKRQASNSGKSAAPKKPAV